MKIIFTAILALSLMAPALCFAEYNPATNTNELILISDDAEVNMGRGISKKVEQEYELVLDPRVNERVDRIGESLVKVCDRKSINYRFCVIKDKKDKEIINAFCLPGGYIYVFKGLLDKVGSDDELAAVLAHEIGHTAARHTVKRLQGGIGLTAVKTLMALTGAIRDAKSAYLADVAMIELMLSYSREDELLADRLAVKYMEAAGYDPKAMVTFLEKLQDIHKKEPLRPYTNIQTHPYLDDRIGQARMGATGKITFRDYMNDGRNLP